MSTRVETTIKIEGEITEAQKAKLIEEADNCYVTRVIRGEWDFAHSTELIETAV